MVDEPVVRWWEPLLVGSLAWLICLLLLPNILTKLNPVTGDEPFYLVTAISLLRDHDLDESNNYVNRDYWQFAPSCEEMRQPDWGLVGEVPVYNVPGVLAPGLRDDCKGINLPLEALSTLPPHFSNNVVQPGRYTKHGLGLSFLIAPFFAAGGRTLVVIFVAALFALIGVNTWLLAFETTGQRKVAWLAWAMLQFSTPLLCFAFLIFPATPAALLVVYSWRRLRLAARAHLYSRPDWQSNGPVRALLIGLSLGLLPWLHSLYLLLSIMLFAYWLSGGRAAGLRANWHYLRTRNLQQHSLAGLIFPPGWSVGALVGLFAPLAVLGTLLITYYQYFYGTIRPNLQDHAGFAPLSELPLALLGLLFDQKYGLLIYAPVYMLALSGLWLLLHRNQAAIENSARRSDLIWLAVVALPYVLVIASYNQWWGEWGPPARYLMPVLPLLAVPLALALAELSGLIFKLITATVAAWSLLVAVLFMYNPHLMYNWQTVRPAIALLWLEANVPGLEKAGLGRYLPSYVTNLELNGGQPNWLAAALWLLIVGATGFSSVYFGWHACYKAKR